MRADEFPPASEHNPKLAAAFYFLNWLDQQPNSWRMLNGVKNALGLPRFGPKAATYQEMRAYVESWHWEV